MLYPRLVLRDGKDKALRRGYPWVFANQIDRRASDLAEAGAVVRLEAAGGHAFGLGLYHDTSLIAARFLTTDCSTAVDAAFFSRRIRRALDLRRAAFPDATHARLVFGESDGLPGVVIDRYGPPGYERGALTWSCISFGMEPFREAILDVLEQEIRPAAVVERNDAPLREKEGLAQAKGVLRGELPERIAIWEAGVRFAVDVLHGPKTGFFIDQRLNRLAVRSLAAGRRVLDVFSADGGFGLHALHAGAEHVHMIDASAAALARARANAEHAGVTDRLHLEQGDALQRLGQLADEGAAYDFIVLDPPSFAPSRRHVEAAAQAYQRLNICALRILPPGGMLVTASCSQAIGEGAFERILRYSARRAGARVRLLLRGAQPPDHPVLEAMPETHYLKCYLLQKLDDEVPASAPGYSKSAVRPIATA